MARLRARTNARTSLALRPVNCPPVPTFRIAGRARVTGVTEHLIGTGRLHVPVHTARHDSHQRPGDAVNRLVHPPRPIPTAEINVQYAAFVADFSLVEVVSSANVPGIAQSSTAAVFPTTSPIAQRQMAINLIVYFNGFPIKLPAFNAPPHTPIQRGAIQSYVYQQVAEASPTSIVDSLLTIPCPPPPAWT